MNYFQGNNDFSLKSIMYIALLFYREWRAGNTEKYLTYQKRLLVTSNIAYSSAPQQYHISSNVDTA